MKIKLLLLTFISITSLLADGYRIEVKKILNSNVQDSYIPDLILPVSWSENLSSSLVYRSGEATDEREFDPDPRITDSLISESIKQYRVKLNVIEYSFLEDNYSYSFGLGASYENYDKKQTGYFVALGENHTYDNNIDITIMSFYVRAESIYKFKYLDTKLYGIIIPVSNLEVTQDTDIEGLYDNLNASSSKSQNISYEIDLEMTSKLNTFVDINLNAKYRFLPLDYSLDAGSGSKNTNIEEDILLMAVRLYFNIDMFNGWMPTIAYSNEVTKSKDASDGSVRTLEENILYVGLNTRF